MKPLSRRVALKSSLFGLIGVSIPNIVYAQSSIVNQSLKKDLFHRYPAIDDAIVKEVVGASHFNLDRVKELVNQRPELARATWDWGFGDWETAIGAASHVGRRDIATFLMSKGARPNLFTYAMFGHYKAVKAMIESIPNVQQIAGPHGISLLQHAKSGLRMKGLSSQAIKNSNKLIRYLEKLGNAGSRQQSKELTAEEKKKYIGDYVYGDQAEDGFSIKLNMRKMVSLGKIGTTGGALLYLGNHEFIHSAAPSVKVNFEEKEGQIVALTLTEPDLVLRATKIA